MAELLLLGFRSCRHKRCITHPVLWTVRVVNKKTEKVQGNLMIGDFLALGGSVPVHMVQTKDHQNRVWWLHTPANPALRSWRQEDEKFKVILGYIMSLRPSFVRPCLKKIIHIS